MNGFFKWLDEHAPNWTDNGESSRSKLLAKSICKLKFEGEWAVKYELLSHRLEAFDVLVRTNEVPKEF